MREMLVLLGVSDGALRSRNTAAAAPNSIGSPKGVPARGVDLGSAAHHSEFTYPFAGHRFSLICQFDLSVRQFNDMHHMSKTESHI